MADFALGLTKNAVEGTLSRVQSAIDEEDKLRTTAQEDLVFITGEFQMMQAFLSGANKERAKNQVVKTWVRQLRDLAFDVEDCVELVVHLDNGSALSCLWRIVPSFMRPRRALELDMAVAELKQLKERVGVVSQRNTRYNLTSDSGSTPTTQENQPATAGPSTLDTLKELWAANKKRSGLCDLRELITDEASDRKVISIWRSAGAHLEAEHIISTTLSDPGIGQEFKVHARVKLMYPFNRDKFIKSLLTQLYDSSDQEKLCDELRNKEDHLIQDELFQLLSKHKYLITVEDLSSVVEWNFIKKHLPDIPNGSRIVILTEQLGVALACTGEPFLVSELRQFPDRRFLHAFFKKVPSKEQSDAKSFLEKAWALLMGRFAQHANTATQYQQRTQGDAYNYSLLGNGPRDSQILLSNRVEEAFRVPFIESQNDVRQKIHLFHVCRSGVNTVWGTIGVGKSALVRCSYYAEIVRSMDYPSNLPDNNDLYYVDPSEIKFHRFGWVHVPDPFDLAEFSRRLFLDFSSLDPQQMETTAVGIIQGHNPIQGCYEILRNNTCLLVIDGLRSTHEWDSIEEALLCQLAPSSSVVVITLEESVARHCVHHRSAMFNVRALDDAEAFVLFKKIADGKKELTSIKLEYAKHIVPKCGGLPQIISSVAQASGSFWENVNDDLIVKLHTDTQFHSLSGLLSWLHSYFDACSDSVKPCVFYLSVFPTNYKIRKGRLIRRWITEGYSRDTNVRTAKENAEKLFSELVKLGIIQQAASNGIYQINGFFREYIISQPMEDNLVFALEGHCKVNSQRTGQHLTVMNSWDNDKHVFKSIDVSRLRSLTVFGKWQKFFLSENMKRIRVLDLEGTSDVNDISIRDIFGKLLCLKFISLRGCINITCLPNTLAGLRQLETLDVRCTSIVTLPPVIIKLLKVQYIRAGSIVSSDEDWTSTPLGYDDGMVSNQAPVTAPAGCSDGMGRSPPPQPAMSPERGHDTKQILQKGWTPKLSRSMLHTSRLLKCPPVSRGSCVSQRKSKYVSAHNGGVEVPVGIEKMAALHTLGVVNINSVHGKDFVAKLSKLTQLLKLRLCGINTENWKELRLALSSLGHLESLSMRLEEACLEDTSFEPPKTLKSLKLYGPIHKFPIWIKELVNLRKLDIEITLSRPSFRYDEELYDVTVTRLCIKPTQEVTNLDFTSSLAYKLGIYAQPRVLKIDCISKLEVSFGRGIPVFVEVLIIHCSRGSSFQVSSDHGLGSINRLKTVWLQGSYSDADRDALKRHVDRHQNKPVMKWEKQVSS